MLNTVCRMALQASVLAVTCAATPLSLAAPVSVTYELVAMPMAGQYQYRYTVKNESSATPIGSFSVDFDPALYDESSLQIMSTGVGDWTEQVLGSIPVLGVPAQYDAYKAIGSPLGIGESEVGFVVQFAWIGSGMPDAQAFTVYDPLTFDVVGGGFTSAVSQPPPNIPEPSSAVLALAALAGLVTVRRRAANAGARNSCPPITLAPRRAGLQIRVA